MTLSRRRPWLVAPFYIQMYAHPYIPYIDIDYIFLQYLSSANLFAGIKAGELHQGHFNANQYNYLEVRIHRSVTIDSWL
jgi:hypothetical protein